MRNLIAANTSRLLRSALFWGLAVLLLIISALNMINAVHRDLLYELNRDLDYYYYNLLPYGIFVAPVFISLFVGREYSEGTIRNKITVGRSRREIYCSNLLICGIALTVFFAAWAAGGLVGISHFGLWKYGIADCLIKLLVAYSAILVLNTLFVAVAHLSSGKASSPVFAIALSLVLLLAFNFLQNGLEEPETITVLKANPTVCADDITMYYSADGVPQFTDDSDPAPETITISNPNYIPEPQRTIRQTASRLLPAGMLILVADSDAPLEQPALLLALSLGVFTVISVGGYRAFLRKDLT